MKIVARSHRFKEECLNRAVDEWQDIHTNKWFAALQVIKLVAIFFFFLNKLIKGGPELTLTWSLSVTASSVASGGAELLWKSEKCDGGWVWISQVLFYKSKGVPEWQPHPKPDLEYNNFHYIHHQIIQTKISGSPGTFWQMWFFCGKHWLVWHTHTHTHKYSTMLPPKLALHQVSKSSWREAQTWTSQEQNMNDNTILLLWTIRDMWKNLLEG